MVQAVQENSLSCSVQRVVAVQPSHASHMYEDAFLQSVACVANQGRALISWLSDTCQKNTRFQTRARVSERNQTLQYEVGPPIFRILGHSPIVFAVWSQRRASSAVLERRGCCCSAPQSRVAL